MIYHKRRKTMKNNEKTFARGKIIQNKACLGTTKYTNDKKVLHLLSALISKSGSSVGSKGQYTSSLTENTLEETENMLDGLLDLKI